MPKIVWECEHCKTAYGLEESAKKCEATHLTPIGLIRGCDYRAGCEYPRAVAIRMSDGKELCYFRSHV